jgi:hypothetical protein
VPRLPQARSERAYERGGARRGSLTDLEVTRRTAERELEAIGGRREEIEELERDREAIRASWASAVPGDLDRLTRRGGTRSTSSSDWR